MPDLAALPAMRMAEARASAEPAASLAAASSISATFDRQLEPRSTGSRPESAGSLSPPPVIVPFDLHAALPAVKQDAAARGGNVVDACFDSDIYRESQRPSASFIRCAPPRSTLAAIR